MQATPLHFAVMCCTPCNVELLLANGADPRAQDFQGNSPLHNAVVRLSQDPDSFVELKTIIKELLFRGADRQCKNNEGNTALDMLEIC
jgi:ankyrin repeat protein